MKAFKESTVCELISIAKEIPDIIIKNPGVFMVIERRDGAILTWNTTLNKPLKEIMDEQRKRGREGVKFTEISLNFEINGKYHEFPIDVSKVI